MTERGQNRRGRLSFRGAMVYVLFAVIGLLLGFWGWNVLFPSEVGFPFLGGSSAGSNYDSANSRSPGFMPSEPDPGRNAFGVKPNGQGTNSQSKEGDTVASSALEKRRAALLLTPYGKAPIGDVLRALTELTGGPELQTLFQVLAMRKGEALPLVKDRLRSGELYEKHMLTKFLRLCPWPETQPELLALAHDNVEEWLPRQGALYALGALGDKSIGPEITAILAQPGSPKGVQLVAISAVARTGYREGADAIRPFAENPDVHVRLFATRALAELDEPVNREFLVSSLQSGDYLIRQEACEALGSVAGGEITEKLQSQAQNDVHEAVRLAATQALLKREIRDLDPAEKLAVLKRRLEAADRHTALWIVQTLIAHCGHEGRDFVGTLAIENNYLGDRSFTYLLFSDINTP